MASIGPEWREEQVDILRSAVECPAADDRLIAELKSRASRSPRRRARWCAHPGDDSAAQEMLIVLCRDVCIAPHRHPGRVETLCVFEGRARAWFFNERGDVVRCLEMTPTSEGGCFFYRTNPREYHTLELLTEFFVFVETTLGPFNPASTEFAPFRPREETPGAYAAFFAGLEVPPVQ